VAKSVQAVHKEVKTISQRLETVLKVTLPKKTK
jgi:hypothetical protein